VSAGTKTCSSFFGGDANLILRLWIAHHHEMPPLQVRSLTAVPMQRSITSSGTAPLEKLRIVGVLCIA
jgi:hypothetical protein